MTTSGASPSARAEIVTERLLFGALLLGQAAIYAWLILAHRMVRGHDTFLSFLNQYLFQAQAAGGGGPMLWIPNIMHGRITNFELEEQGALLQNALLLLGGAPAGTPMLPIFYLTLFVDDLVLLTGVWWLGRRYYRSPFTRFFVAAAVLGSEMWVNHVYFNHRILYAIPLILALIHEFLEDGRRWKLLLAGTLLALQFMGQAFYVPLIILPIVLLYFGVHAIVFPREARAWRAALRPRAADLGVLGLLGSLLGAVAFTLSDGAGEIRLFRQGRNPDATVSLDSFLTYGGNLNPLRYADVFLGVTPSQDYTLYCGAFAAGCMISALFLRPARRVYHLGIVLLLAGLFSTGFLSLVAPAAYELIYPIRYFRYVSLVSPIVKLFLLFLAGHGFEALLARRPVRQPEPRPAPRFLWVIALGVALVAAGWAVPVETLNVAALLRTGMPQLAYRRIEGGPGLPTLVAAVAAGVLFCARILNRRPSAGWIAAALLLQTVDIYRWKLDLLRAETLPLDDRQYAMQRVEAVPYIPRRIGHYDASERFRAFHPSFFTYGAVYAAIDPFLHLDPPRSRYWTTYWLAPYDLLNRAHLGLPLDEAAAVAADREIGDSLSPAAPPSPYRKVIGASEDKIQVFSDAHESRSDQEVADRMNDPEFRGDVLLLDPGPSASGAAAEATPGLLSRNERLAATTEILHFDANRMRLRVQLPEGRTQGWLFYADVWHPEWTARVNGRDVDVRRAFLAYKAIRLEAPSSVVEFRFRAPRRLWGYRLLCAASLAVLGFTVVRLGLLFRARGP